MSIIDGENNGIMTYDKNNNSFLIGELVLRKKEELVELKEGLLADRRIYKVNIENDLGGLSSAVKSGFIREGNSLIHNKITNTEDDVCLYTKRVIECRFLNSLLLFISLSKELDATNYDKITKEFIRMGIISFRALDNIWKVCSANMINEVFAEIARKNVSDVSQLTMADLKLFRYVLAQDIIAYDVKKEIPFAKTVDKAVLKGFTHETRNELAINNALLLNDDEIIKEYVRKRQRKNS